jgi:hypothetical protein
MSETKKSNVVGIMVAVIVLLAVAIAAGLVMYQRRGTVVFENSQAFTGPVLQFAFKLDSGDEHAVLLTRRIHYTSAYEYRMALQIQLPSGKVLEREILDFERMIEETATSTRESSSRGSVVFTFADEPGEAVLKISIVRLEGDVKIERVNLVVKRRE